MNRLDQFLNTAARQMRIMPATLRDDELRELRGHLQQRVEDYQNAGMSDDAAQTRALESLGSPRALGAKLCDAWESIAFSWWRLAAAIVGVTAFLVFGMAFFILALVTIPLNSETALLPEIAPAFCAFYVALPLFCGVLFSHWLGRRGCMVATLYFLALALGKFTVNFPSSGEFEAPSTNFVGLVNGAWFPYFWVALAFAGAWIEQRWRLRKRHQMALSGARILAPSRFLWVPLNLGWWRNAVLATVIIGALYSMRAWTSFHPQTPTATVRNYLILNRQMNHSELEAPRIIAMRELPAQSPAEIAGAQRRVWFKIEERMTPSYQARRVDFARRMLKRSEQQQEGEDKTMRLTLARMQRNRQITQGVATLTKTPDGWRVKSSAGPSPGDWAYDLYYER